MGKRGRWNVVSIIGADSFTATLNGEALENPTAPFGFEGSAPQQIVVTIDGQDPIQINQVSYVALSGPGVVLEKIDRVSPGFESAVTQFNALLPAHPDLILAEGKSFAGFEETEYVIYVGGFTDTAAAEEYCTEKGLGDNCDVVDFTGREN